MNDTTEFIMKPKIDFCFKELMTDAEIRRGFISAVLKIPPEEIAKTELLPTHLRKEFGEAKLGILDVRVLLNCTLQIDTEIQLTSFELWAERSLFYLCKMYEEQIGKGEGYDVLKKCIHIGILNFNLFKEDKEYYSKFHLWEDDRPRMYTDKLEIHIIELPKLTQYDYPETELLKWACFINAERKEELMMIAKTNQYISKAYEALKDISADKKKRMEYEEREKAIRDYNFLMESNMRKGHEQGLDEGIELTKKALRLSEQGKSVHEIARELGISTDTAEKILEL